jgi:hypothetical protein
MRHNKPGHYNLRFRASQGGSGNYLTWEGDVHPIEAAAHKTNRDPNAFKYTNNIFNNDYMEFKTRGGDWLYQIFQRLHRSNDAWTKCMLGWTGFSYLMMN